MGYRKFNINKAKKHTGYDCEKYIGGVALGLKNYFKSRIGRILHTNFPKPIKGEVKILRKYL